MYFGRRRIAIACADSERSSHGDVRGGTTFSATDAGSILSTICRDRTAVDGDVRDGTFISATDTRSSASAISNQLAGLSTLAIDGEEVTLARYLNTGVRL